MSGRNLIRCGRCRSLNQEGPKFCGMCGARLHGTPALEFVRPAPAAGLTGALEAARRVCCGGGAVSAEVGSGGSDVVVLGGERAELSYRLGEHAAGLCMAASVLAFLVVLLW